MPSFDLYKTDRKLAILVDPDKHDANSLLDLCAHVDSLQPDVLLIGGSLVYKANIEESAKLIRSNTKVPLVLFPGHFTQLTEHVDAVLLLSLISGRNPDLLIGQHVLAAPRLKRMAAKKISTGYMLIDGGQSTSVSYMSHTQPIPSDKVDIAVCTAQAGELVGMHCIYMDAGSGAKKAVPTEMVKSVAEATDIPLIVGGGLRSLEAIEGMWNAGANLVVIGNALEDQHHPLFRGLSERIRSGR